MCVWQQEEHPPSLIDKAVEHTEEAAEAQMAAAGDELL